MAEKEARGAPTPLVLVVEDEEPIALALSLIIEDAGYSALYTTDARQALTLARDHDPSLVMTDLMMPRMNGEQFVAALRAQVAHDGTDMPSIIVMTATDLQYTVRIGADAVMGKPFDLKTVEALLERFLPHPSRTA